MGVDQSPRVGHANSRIAFIDPKSTGNVLIELVELPDTSEHWELYDILVPVGLCLAVRVR